MKDFLRQNGILLLVIALLLSILIGVLSFVMGGVADPLSNMVTTIATPFRSGIAAAAPTPAAARPLRQAAERASLT